MTSPARVGLVGCGVISAKYAAELQRHDGVTLAACADQDPARARAFASRWSVPRCLAPDELLAAPDVDVVLNLTPPFAHAEVNGAALSAGKHVYSEKPLAATFEEGAALVEQAGRLGLLIGGAPDTFFAAGMQAARLAIDAGAIGRPLSAFGAFASPGHERWHPNPDLYYRPGGGPMLDMGPYYVTALVFLLGPAVRVTGSVSIGVTERRIAQGERAGEVIHAEAPTHVTGTIEFASGAVATLLMSFDVAAHRLPVFEIYGTEATLEAPDPESFESTGSVLGDDGSVPLETEPIARERGVGLVDMAQAIATGATPRASGALALHVLEVLSAFEASSRSGRHVELRTTAGRPEPLGG